MKREVSVITLEVDARRGVCPLPVVLRGLLKIPLRRYGYRCVSCRLEPEIGSKARSERTCSVS